MKLFQRPAEKWLISALAKLQEPHQLTYRTSYKISGLATSHFLPYVVQIVSKTRRSYIEQHALAIL